VVTDEDPDLVCVFAADHVYKMDVAQMVDAHIESGAAVTVAAVPVPAAEASAYGVLDVDGSGRVVAFAEKPERAPEMAGRPGYALASMGNYVWDTRALVEELRRDAASAEDSQQDFGRNILPSLHGRAPVAVYDFTRNVVPGEDERSRGYWRDVGTIPAFYRANMDLVQVHPVLNLHNPRWPIHTRSRPLPPAKFLFSDPQGAREGVALDSLVAEGCIVSGGRVERSILHPDVRVNSCAHVEDSILLDGVSVGRRARLRRAIVDKGVSIPEAVDIGLDRAADEQRGLFVCEDNLVVVPKGHRF